MATTPLNRIVLAARSVADDLSYVALTDIASVLASRTTEYRIIGGLMVTAHVARWDLGASLYRETMDADLGLAPLVLRDLGLADRLKAAGYEQIAGDRFEKLVSDIPAGVPSSAASTYRAAIDVLVPAYTSRPRQNVKVGPDLVTTEVLGLQIALARNPVELTLDLRRLNADLLSIKLLFPDEVSALTLKAFATRVRMKPSDVIDVWRCLEICFAANIDAKAFNRGTPAEAAAIIRELFDGPDSPGIRTLAEQQRLSPNATDQRQTRIRALIARLLSPAGSVVPSAGNEVEGI